MADINELLAQIPTGQIAGRLGVDEETAEEAIRQALPALVGGLQANAQDPAGAASLSDALTQHDSALVDGGVDLDQVDTDDGDRIVGHVFGGQREAVVQQVAGASGPRIDGSLIARLLPMLAPIVLSYLSKRLLGAGPGGFNAGPGGVAGGSAGSAGGLGDVLGGLLKGAAGGSGSRSGGGGLDIGDLLGGLGGLLGGGRR